MSGLAANNGRPPRRGAPPRAVVGVVVDETTRSALADAIARLGIPCSLMIGEIDNALARLDMAATAECVIVDLDGVSDAIDDVAVLVGSLPSHIDLVVLGAFSEAEEDELKQAGATFCLSKPLTEAALFRVFGDPTTMEPAAPKNPDVPATANRTTAAPERHRPDSPIVPPRPSTSQAQPPPQPEPSLFRASNSAAFATREEPRAAMPAPAPTYHRPEFAAGPAESAPLHGSPTVGRTDLGAYPSANGIGAQNPLSPSFSAPAPHTTMGEWAAPSAPHQNLTAQQPNLVKGRVISVVSCRGGVGATTLAVGLAWLLAEEMNLNTALLDLDPFYGSISLALNLDPGEGLHQALEKPNRVDTVFLDRAMRKVGRNLLVLSNEQSLIHPTRPEPGAAATLIRTLAGHFERVVVDMPRGDPDTMAQALTQSDEVLLVTDLSLAGARDATRLMVLVRRATPYARVRIIGGGARDNGKSPILSPSEFRRAVGTTIEATIAYDPETAADAARSGRAIPKVSPRSAASKAMRNLMRTLEVKNSAGEPKRRLLWWK